MEAEQHATPATVDMNQTDQVDQVTLFNTPATMWDALLEDCAAATSHIHIDHYILKIDVIGMKLLQLLIDKVKNGVKVDIILDRVGGRSVYGSGLMRTFRAAGGRIRFYNDLSILHIFTPSKWFPRNHVKTVIIDQHTLYVGSACLASDMAEWRDLHLKIAGPCVCTLLTNQNGVLRYAVSKPRLRRNPIYRELISQINGAQHTIQLVTPYFLPPVRLRNALKRAVKRGVDVKIMLGEKTDVPVADCVSRSFFPNLLLRGVRIFAFKPRVFHAKYMIIDGTWATIGSCNLDYLSLFLNREANLMVTDPKLISFLQDQFMADEKECQEIDMIYYHNLPLWYKCAAWAGRIFKKIL